MRFFILLNITLLLCSCTQERFVSDTHNVWGLDVSWHQKQIEWDKTLTDEYPKFVFLKATEGTLIEDKTYEQNVEVLSEQKDVVWGAYHFFGHRTSGKEQARNFIKKAKLSTGNLYPVLDIEEHRFMTDAKKSVREAKAFCREINNYYGVNPIIYCSTKFYESYLKNDFKADDYFLWIADYRGESPDHINWTIWQHTDKHKIEGIEGRVDRNIFNGSLKELRKLIL